VAVAGAFLLSHGRKPTDASVWFIVDQAAAVGKLCLRVKLRLSMPNLIGKVVVRGWDAGKRQWKSGMPHFGRWWGTTHGAAPPTGRNMNWALGAGGLAVVALAAAGVIVATGGDGAGETQGDPSARSCRTTTLLAGAKDGYSSAVDTPSASLSQGLQTRLSGSPLVGFDSGAIDRRFAHTFAGLPQGIVAASVTLRLKPIQSSISPGSRNDTLDLSFTDAAGSLQPAVGPGSWAAATARPDCAPTPGIRATTTAGISLARWTWRTCPPRPARA